MFYVSAWHTHAVVEIEKFHRESGWRTLTPPWPAGALLEPAGIALNPDGRLLIADRGHHRIVILSPDRKTASALAPDGDPISSLWKPTGVAVGANGEVLIADTGNHRIVRCDNIDAPVWSAFGAAGGGVGQFVAPSGIVADSLGRIVIADPGASRVVRIDAMDGSGWVEFPLPPNAAGPRPYGVTPGLGGIVIADPGASRILLLSNAGDGDSVTTIIDGAVDGSLLAPIAAVQFAGELFVADPAGASLARFTPPDSDHAGWTLAARLYGQRAAFPSPQFPRIGGFTAGASM
jgi:DNA-binding beta-propeller fold protein YncE